MTGLSGPVEAAAAWTAWAQLCPSAGVLPGHVPASWGAGGRRPGFSESPLGVLSAGAGRLLPSGAQGPLVAAEQGVAMSERRTGLERFCSSLVAPVTSSCCVWTHYVFTLKKEGHKPGPWPRGSVGRVGVPVLKGGGDSRSGRV